MTFKSSYKSIFCNLFYNFFFIYIKISKNLSAKYYQENKKRLQKKHLKETKLFLNKKKKKSNIMVVNVTKISQKMKNKSLLSIEKNIVKWKKYILSKESILIWKMLLLYNGKYKKRFPFVLMLEKFSLNKQRNVCEGAIFWKYFLKDIFWRRIFFKKYFLKCISWGSNLLKKFFEMYFLRETF